MTNGGDRGHGSGKESPSGRDSRREPSGGKPPTGPSSPGGAGGGGKKGGREEKDDKDKSKKKPPKKPPKPPDDDDGDDDDEEDEGSDDYGSAESEDDKAETSKRPKPKGSLEDVLLKALTGQSKRLKEATEIKLPAMPDAVGFKQWKLTVRSKVADASGRGDDGLRWVMKVEDATASFESLADSGKGFTRLDMKLSAAITTASTGEVGREVAEATEAAAKNGKMLRGRQALWLVYQWYKVTEEAGALFDLSDLMKVELEGHNLSTFQQNWVSILGMKKEPDKQTMATLYHMQIQDQGMPSDQA